MENLDAFRPAIEKSLGGTIVSPCYVKRLLGLLGTLFVRFSSFRLPSLVAFALVLCLFPCNVYSVDVTLSWQENSEEDLAGYRVFCRQEGQSYDYDDPAWEGSNTTCTIYNLDANATHYFVGRAFDTSGNISDDSNEECYQPNVGSTEVITINPGFEDGKSPWIFYTNGEGSFAVSSPAYDGLEAARITMVTAGTNVQLHQYNLSLEPNTDYQLSFSAYSNTGHDMAVSIFQNVQPYTSYGLSRHDVNLTTSWNTYTIDFTTPDFGAPVDDARLMFWFADDATAGDEYWIDNVILRNADSSLPIPPSPPLPTPPPPTTNIALNPGFEDGTSFWNFYTNGQGDLAVIAPGHDSSNAACITTDTGGTNIQLYQYNLSLEPNTKYQLSFSGYSNTGRDMTVSIFKDVHPYTNYGLSRHDVNLGTSWNTYTIDFTTPDFGAPVDDARLMFWFADDATAGDEYWIDNVILCNADSPLPSPSPPPPTTDITLNADFEAGTGSWKFFTNGQGDFVVSTPGHESFRAACITTDTGGTNIQLYRYDLPLEPNTNYQLSFASYSNTGHGLAVSIFKHVQPYTNYGLSHCEVDLTTSWDTYIIDFRTPDFTNPVDDARLMFWFADDATAGDEYWIDNVILSTVN